VGGGALLGGATVGSEGSEVLPLRLMVYFKRSVIINNLIIYTQVVLSYCTATANGVVTNRVFVDNTY